MFETFEHTADLGLRVRADNLSGLFVDAARGLFSIIVEDLASVRPETSVSYEIAGAEPDYLLVDWLTELIFTFESRRILLGRFDVSVDGVGLKAKAWGEPIDADRHKLQNEVKAVTYHGLKVEQVNQGWLAEVILDI
jgi:SHS2 domain-containing protein